MGILKAAVGAFSSVLEEQWREFFFCDAMNDGTILLKAEKRIGKYSANTRKDDDVLTSGSVLCVAEGQCVLVVRQGKVIDFCAEPGEHIFEDPEQDGLKGFFREVGRRISFGGGDIQPVVCRVYYMNVKEITGNPFRTQTPIPLRLRNGVSGLDLDAGVSLGGVYSYRVSDPVKLYKTIIGNVSGRFTREDIAAHMNAELLRALSPAIAELSRSGLRPASVPEHCPELCDALRAQMNRGWCGEHGLELGTVAIDGFEFRDSPTLQSAQYASMLRDPAMAGAVLTAAAAEALPLAAGNTHGPAIPAAAVTAPAAETGQRLQSGRPVDWSCTCGQRNKSRFCENCGKKRPD